MNKQKWIIKRILFDPEKKPLWLEDDLYEPFCVEPINKDKAWLWVKRKGEYIDDLE